MKPRETPDQRHIIDYILDERHSQDVQWGGQAHDDKHVLFDWVSYIEHQIVYIANPVIDEDTGEPVFDIEDQRRLAYHRFVKIAALAIAACEQIERQNKITATAVLREIIAYREHEQWADYMRYFLDKLERTFDGLVITPRHEKNLRKLIDTKYSELDEKQKNNDRAEADKIIDLFREWTNTEGLGD